MKIKVYASSSSGNFYTIEDNNQILFIEAGIKIQEIKKALNFNFDNVVGCIVSHAHSDHSKSIKGLLDSCITVCSSEYTLNKYSSHYKKLITSEIPFKLGEYNIMPFSVKHDCPDSLGFAIITPSGKRILFATDTQYVKKKFKNINVYMLECNYDLHSMRKAIKCKKIDDEVLLRVSNTHMSLETVCEYLEEVDLSSTDHIVLLHLSDDNSHEKKYKETVHELTQINTFIADKGVEINYNDEIQF